VRQHGTPVLLTAGGLVRATQMPLGDGDYTESWLQNLLVEHPDMLPVDEIASGFSPLVPAGTEIGCVSGSIDNLFISPSGGITVVETKLWRNPEARREVVAQIVDYAQALSTWTYEDLSGAVRAAVAHDATDWSLYEHVQQSVSVQGQARPTEDAFVDQVARCLDEGRFLLLIVGDGIRRDAEAMVRFLQRAPQLHFTLALIEVAVYELPNGDRLLVPRTTARTEAISRAVVQVETRQGTPEGKVEVYVNVETPALDEVAEEPVDFETRCAERGTWWIQEGIMAAARELEMEVRPTPAGYTLFARRDDGHTSPVYWGRPGGVLLPLWHMLGRGIPKPVVEQYRSDVEGAVSLTSSRREPWGEFPDTFGEQELSRLVQALRGLQEALSEQWQEQA